MKIYSVVYMVSGFASADAKNIFAAHEIAWHKMVVKLIS